MQLCPTIDPSSIFWQVHIISNKKKRKTFYSQGLEDHGKEGWTGVWYPQFKSRYLVSTSTSLKYENSTVRTLTSQCLLLSAQWGYKIYDFLIKHSGKKWPVFLNLVLFFQELRTFLWMALTNKLRFFVLLYKNVVIW